MVKMHRIRKWATSSAGCFFSSRFDTSASRSAIWRVTRADSRVGSSDRGSVQMAFSRLTIFASRKSSSRTRKPLRSGKWEYARPLPEKSA